MSQLQTAESREVIPKRLTKKEALIYLLAIRKKIDIMTANLIEFSSDRYEKDEIDNILHTFFYG